MSGGLLEKAKKKTDEDEGMFTAVGDPENPELKKESDDSKGSGSGGGLLEKGSVKKAATPNKPLMLYAAAATLLVGMVLLYLLGSLPAYSGLAVLALIVFSGYLASLHAKQTNDGAAVKSTQWATIAVAYVLLSAVPYGAGMEWSGSTTITDIEFSDDGMQMTVEFRQTGGLLGDTFDGGNVDVWVKHGSAETYRESLEATMGNAAYGALGSVTVSIVDIYDSNAFEVTGKMADADGDWVPEVSESAYHIYVAAGDSDAGAASISSSEMTRTVNDVDGDADPIYSQSDSECDGDKESCVVGLVLESWLGIGNSAVDSNIYPARTSGWYTVDATFAYKDGDQTMITFPTITVTETIADWNSTDDQFGDGASTVGEYSSYLILEGSTSEGDTLERLHFPREDVFDDYGCYTLTVSATNDAEWGGGTVSETTHFEWNDIIADDGNGHYESEEFKQVLSC